MKKRDITWSLAMLIIIGLFIYIATTSAFGEATKLHPYLMGFLKVSILATIGELVSMRISSGTFKCPKGIVYKFIVWGFIGMAFALVFQLFSGGVVSAKTQGLLPYGYSDSLDKFLTALLTSALMNLIFAPTFMATHRITDTYIDLGEGSLKKIHSIKMDEVLSTIDWKGFIQFVVFKTIPIFWIPAHTITFLLPPEYRVIMAAFLSLFLGAILAYAKRPAKVTTNTLSQ